MALTPLARDYLEAQRSASRRIERKLRQKVGEEVFESLWVLFDAMDGGGELPRMRDYVRQAGLTVE